MRLMVMIVTLASLAALIPAGVQASGHRGGGGGGGGGGGYGGGGAFGGFAPLHTYEPPPTRAPAPMRTPLVRAMREPRPTSDFLRSTPTPAVQRTMPPSSQRECRRETDRMTDDNYRQHRTEIDPAGMRGKRQQVDFDHIMAVKRCYEQGYEQGMSP